MYSRLSKIIKTEDLSIRYKDCDTSVNLSSAKKKVAKIVKEAPLTLRPFKITWGDVGLN